MIKTRRYRGISKRGIYLALHDLSRTWYLMCGRTYTKGYFHIKNDATKQRIVVQRTDLFVTQVYPLNIDFFLPNENTQKDYWSSGSSFV